MALTWPVARDFTTRLAGAPGDPHLTLWSMRWMRDALLSFENPFFTPRLYHPHGTTLVFHTFDLPSTLLVVPLWDVLPDVAIYNTAVLFAFTLTAYGMFRLVREMSGDVPVALVAGVLFSAVPYHSAHLHGQLHLMSMGWVPLYLVHLLRIVSGRARRRDAVLGGLFLALAALASWYHLLFAALATVPIVGYGVLYHRAAWRPAPLLTQVLLLAATWLVCAGPLFAAMVLAKQREDIVGAHDSLLYSADLYSFVKPSAIQTWCLEGTQASTPWGVELGEHATFVGFTVLLLALLGATAHRLGLTFMVVALLGAVVSLGPHLQWNGTDLGVTLPYGYVENAVPIFRFIGVPVRFGYVMYLGLVGAAAFGLVRLRRLVRVPVLSLALVVAVSALALYEYAPCATPTSESPVPAVVRTWATDPGDWAVLDVSGWLMWHGTFHRKPMVGGYLGRVPKRLEDWVLQQPVLRAITWPDANLPMSRVDPAIDFAWGGAPRQNDMALVGDRFSVEWTGRLLAPTDGRYTFWLSATAYAELRVGPRNVVGRRGVYSHGVGLHEQEGAIDLHAGEHLVLVTLTEARPDAAVHLSWAPPGEQRHVVPAGALRAADGRPGLDGNYTRHIPPLSGLGRSRGRDALRALAIRYVITADTDNPCVQQELELPQVYRGEGLRIYEIPAA